MSTYINPPDMTKEEWLEKNAEIVGKANVPKNEVMILEHKYFRKGTVPVVLVDNGPFTAAAVAYTESLYKKYTALTDMRPRIIFQADIEAIRKVSNLDKDLAQHGMTLSDILEKS